MNSTAPVKKTAQRKGWVHVGGVCVDSAQLLIVDPCYLKNTDIDKLYQQACDVTLSPLGVGGCLDPNGWNLALATRTGWGDGRYHVYAQFRGDRVKAIKIEFMS